MKILAFTLFVLLVVLLASALVYVRRSLVEYDHSMVNRNKRRTNWPLLGGE